MGENEMMPVVLLESEATGSIMEGFYLPWGIYKSPDPWPLLSPALHLVTLLLCLWILVKAVHLYSCKGFCHPVHFGVARSLLVSGFLLTVVCLKVSWESILLKNQCDPVGLHL